MLAFTLGALLPLLTITLFSPALRVWVTVGSVTVALALTGWGSARFGYGPARRAVVRNVVGGFSRWRSPTRSGLLSAPTFGLGLTRCGSSRRWSPRLRPSTTSTPSSTYAARRATSAGSRPTRSTRRSPSSATYRSAQARRPGRTARPRGRPAYLPRDADRRRRRLPQRGPREGDLDWARARRGGPHAELDRLATGCRAAATRAGIAAWTAPGSGRTSPSPAPGRPTT